MSAIPLARCARRCAGRAAHATRSASLLAAVAARARRRDRRCSRGTRTCAQLRVLPPGSNGIVVLDLSASISDDTYSRIGATLADLAASRRPLRPRRLLGHGLRGAAAGHAGRGARAARPLLHAAAAEDGRASCRRFPPNPWTATFSAGTRISTGLELAHTLDPDAAARAAGGAARQRPRRRPGRPPKRTTLAVLAYRRDRDPAARRRAQPVARGRAALPEARSASRARSRAARLPRGARRRVVGQRRRSRGCSRRRDRRRAPRWRSTSSGRAARLGCRSDEAPGGSCVAALRSSCSLRWRALFAADVLRWRDALRRATRAIASRRGGTAGTRDDRASAACPRGCSASTTTSPRGARSASFRLTLRRARRPSTPRSQRQGARRGGDRARGPGRGAAIGCRGVAGERPARRARVQRPRRGRRHEPGQAERAVSAFENAVRLEPGRRGGEVQPRARAPPASAARGVRIGATTGAGPRGEGRRGAGTGTPGAGY